MVEGELSNVQYIDIYSLIGGDGTIQIVFKRGGKVLDNGTIATFEAYLRGTT